MTGFCYTVIKLIKEGDENVVPVYMYNSDTLQNCTRRVADLINPFMLYV